MAVVATLTFRTRLEVCVPITDLPTANAPSTVTCVSMTSVPSQTEAPRTWQPWVTSATCYQTRKTSSMTSFDATPPSSRTTKTCLTLVLPFPKALRSLITARKCSATQLTRSNKIIKPESIAKAATAWAAWLIRSSSIAQMEAILLWISLPLPTPKWESQRIPLTCERFKELKASKRSADQIDLLSNKRHMQMSQGGYSFACVP